MEIETNVEFVTTHDKAPWGIFLSEVEFDAMTAEQLRQAIVNYGLCVVRRPDGSFNLCDFELNVHDTHDLCRADVKHGPDGSYAIVKMYERPRPPIMKVV